MTTNSKESFLLQRIHKALHQLSEGNRQEALEIFDQLPAELPDNDEEVLQGAGILAFNLGLYARAIDLLSRLVARHPENISYLDQLAAVYSECGRPAEAFHLLQRVLAINPEFASSLINLSKLYIDDKNYPEAIRVLEKARLHEPNNVSLLINLALSYNNMGEADTALKLIKKAEKIASRIPGIHRLMGSLYGQLGHPDNAVEHYKKELAISKYSGLSYWGIASSKKATDADRSFIQQAESLLDESMPAVERGLIHFAIAKMYDDLKVWDKAFDHYRKGNLLRKSTSKPTPPYGFIKNIKRHCTPKLDKPDLYVGSKSEQPIFILGMPRTGSTLTEQIISSHPQATTAGELTTMHEIAASIFVPDNKPKADIEKQLTPEALQKHASHYLAILGGLNRSQALRIIDKSPGNFFQLSLILLLFPNARIIHTTRHPLDTLLSCYCQPFASVIWAQDFAWQGEAYRVYRDLMAYWESILPEGRMLTVSYENLIENPETESRRIMEYCGLDWQPSCLDFFRREGSVRTASTWQVRQPIYQTSRMRWVNYAPYLKDLAQDIRPYLSEGDIEIFRQQGISLKHPNPLISLFNTLVK